MKIAIVSSDIADRSLYENSKSLISNVFPDVDWDYVNSDADVIFFATGGSEKAALEAVSVDKPVVLLANNRNNSYAAATEVLSYLFAKKHPAKLINISSIKETGEILNVEYLFKDINKVYDISGTEYMHKTAVNKDLMSGRIAVIGNVSEWLVNSDISADDLSYYFGIKLLHIPWDDLPDFHSLAPDYDFCDKFPQVSRGLLVDTSKVYRLLKNVVSDYNLEGITVECFNIAVRDKVTACLPLSVLNSEGCPAACEGDVTALAGMLYIKAKIGDIPWQANLVELCGNTALWAHCTAPLNIVNNVNVVSHFETNIGTAIQGDFKARNCTIFRFDKKLKQFFLCEAKIKSCPKHDFACRTQLQVVLPDEAAEILRVGALGNHHLILINN